MRGEIKTKSFLQGKMTNDASNANNVSYNQHHYVKFSENGISMQIGVVQNRTPVTALVSDM